MTKFVCTVCGWSTEADSQSCGKSFLSFTELSIGVVIYEPRRVFS